MEKRKNRNIYKIVSKDKNIITIADKHTSIKISGQSAKVTIVTSSTSYSEYKRSENLYIKRVSKLFVRDIKGSK